MSADSAAPGADLSRYTLGFLGLGVMGEPMAANLVHAGVRLVVWNRSSRAAEALGRLGAEVAESPAEVFARAPVVATMLADGDVSDAVLARHTLDFDSLVRDRTVIQFGTTTPAYSRALADDIAAAGGQYVEAPVSGSRVPAERGELVVMVAGERAVVESVAPLLGPLGRRSFVCGAVPSALRLKLAVNLYLITMVSGLAEAFHFAEQHGLDRTLLQAVIEAGPMASSVAAAKAAKLVAEDYSVQASVRDVSYNATLVAAEARLSGAATPTLDVSNALFAEAIALGHGADDMAGVIQALRARARDAEPAAPGPDHRAS